jgi:hypothetical protein
MRAAPKGERVYQKADDSYRKSVQKTAKAFSDVENGLPQWNSQAEQIIRHDRRTVLSAYEHLEMERLGVLFESLNQAVVSLESLLAPLKSGLEDMRVVMDGVDDGSQMEKFVDKVVDADPTPSAFENFKLGLPCSSDTIVANGEQLRNLLDDDVHTSIAKYEIESEPDRHQNSLLSPTSTRQNRGRSRTETRTSRAEQKTAQSTQQHRRQQSIQEQTQGKSGQQQQQQQTQEDDPFGFEEDNKNPFDSPAALSTAPQQQQQQKQQQQAKKEAPAADTSATEDIDEYAQALYDFQTDDPADLPLKEGDVVCVLSKDGDWWSGSKVVDGAWSEEGSFPSAYVGPYDAT